MPALPHLPPTFSAPSTCAAPTPPDAAHNPPPVAQRADGAGRCGPLRHPFPLSRPHVASAHIPLRPSKFLRLRRAQRLPRLRRCGDVLVVELSLPARQHRQKPTIAAPPAPSRARSAVRLSGARVLVCVSMRMVSIQYLRSVRACARPPSRPPTPGLLRADHVPPYASLRNSCWRSPQIFSACGGPGSAMVVVVDVSLGPCCGCHNTPPPAAPRPPLRLRIAACPRRCGTACCRWGGLAAACATVTRALLGLLLLAAPPPCCYSPAHIRRPACLSTSLCASPLRSLRMFSACGGPSETWLPMWCGGCGLAATPRLSRHWQLHAIPHTAHSPPRADPSGGLHPPLLLSTRVCQLSGALWLWIAVILIGNWQCRLRRGWQRPRLGSWQLFLCRTSRLCRQLCFGPHRPLARARRLIDGGNSGDIHVAPMPSTTHGTWDIGPMSPQDVRAKARGAMSAEFPVSPA